MLTTRGAQREIAAWLRRHRRAAEPLAAALDAVRSAGGIGSGGERLDWGAMAATAEAFDGCCLVRRDDRMASSLTPGDPLERSLGVCGGALLGIAATTIGPDLSPQQMAEALQAWRATIWLARAGQVARLAALPRSAVGRPPEVIVLPIAAPADLAAAREAAEAFREAHGIEPVVAFAPEAVGGLVSMNTPPSRFAVDEMVTCRPASLGRVVTGVVVWPEASLRVRLGLGGEAAPADATLVVAAGGARRGSDEPDDPPSFLLPPGYLVDDEGFLFPPGSESLGMDAGAVNKRRAPRETGLPKSNLG
jgi:hypothetical protein